MPSNYRRLIASAAAAIALVACQYVSIAQPAPTQSGLRLPHVFSDNMILQQDAVVPVWGWGEEGDLITVTFRKQMVSTHVKNGKWEVKLRKLKAGGPDVLSIHGKTAIELQNVSVGEVWVASGQSNMEFPLSRAFESGADVSAAANPMIHLLHVPKAKSDSPAEDVGASWKECNPGTVGSFSAVAYYFARDLQKALQVPVGIIESDWGGTPAEAWTRRAVLETNPRYKKDIVETFEVAQQKYEQDQATYNQAKSQAKDSGQTFTNRPPRAPWRPGELYNGMIAPLIPYAIKGVIWYQGESNADRPARANQYRSLFPDMIRNWRADWDEGAFPFLLVQLAPYMSIQREPGDSTWALLREAQLETTKILPDVGMAVITDVGEERDIHPTKKQPVGARLSLAARGIAYQQKIEYSGPVYRRMEIHGDKAIVTFDHAGDGLEARGADLTGFAVCGEDGKYVWAIAEIEQPNKVIVHSPAVPTPTAVRYGWANYPVVNLWNKDGLPASPFRTEPH